MSKLNYKSIPRLVKVSALPSLLHNVQALPSSTHETAQPLPWAHLIHLSSFSSLQPCSFASTRISSWYSFSWASWVPVASHPCSGVGCSEYVFWPSHTLPASLYWGTSTFQHCNASRRIWEKSLYHNAGIVSFLIQWLTVRRTCCRLDAFVCAWLEDLIAVKCPLLSCLCGVILYYE